MKYITDRPNPPRKQTGPVLKGPTVVKMNTVLDLDHRLITSWPRIGTRPTCERRDHILITLKSTDI